jgi:hypothetical protein
MFKHLRLFSNLFLLMAVHSFLPLQGYSEPGFKTVFEEDFSGFRSGLVGSVVGAHTEYHYLSEAGPKGAWHISTFTSDPTSQRAWRVIKPSGVSEMVQAVTNTRKHTHPMLIAGDEFWGDYSLSTSFSPESKEKQSGVVFRYRNDRCHYFLGVKGGRAILKKVQHARAFHEPHEEVLDESAFAWKPGDLLEAEVRVEGERIAARIGDCVLEATDATFPRGKIGLTADIPTRYRKVEVRMSPEAERTFHARRKAWDEKEAELQTANPQPTVWKRIVTKDIGVGRNLRFGDLDGDGEIDILLTQVVHHGPKDRNSEVGCLTAIDLEGKILWQSGTPDPWNDMLTNDVGVQIHDLDGDGGNEVIYCRDREIVVAEGATGQIKYKAPTPETPADTETPYDLFPRILGDSLYFCDLRGTGHESDIIIKDRYQHLWALDNRLEVLWTGSCVTGHYPYAYDVDGDGKDELSIGYSLFDDDGTKLWSLDDRIKDHADGVAIVKFDPENNDEPMLLCAASDEGMFFADMKGNILKHHFLGHVQNPAIANFRDDLPGLEAVSINFWGNQGIVHYFDRTGDLIHDFEPCQHGSMCLPINWNGTSEEFFVLSANVEEGGMFDGWGRKVVRFPADGHPDLCNAVLDLTGDCRDEVVVWDPYEIWIYTQSDNPREGKLYSPKRNSLSNYSNYQTTVSLPGWNQ